MTHHTCDGSAYPLYRCKHCGKTVRRNSDKAWVKGFCDKTNKTVHLMRVLPKRSEQ